MRRQLKLRCDLSRLMRGSVALPTSRKGTVMLCSGIIRKSRMLPRCPDGKV